VSPEPRDADAGAAVVSGLAGLPGGGELLQLASEGGEVALVGGAVRDLLLGVRPRELDVVVAGEASAFAHELAGRLGGREGRGGAGAASPTLHERFGTAVVDWGAGRVDVARRRAETYAAPGALPDVRPGTLAEDLRRRDFTVNAVAVGLSGTERGRLEAVPDALADLDAARLRVMHDASFLDDPTRLLRLGRYQARLGFAVEPHTGELAAAAIASGALASVSGARVGAELRLALAEADPVAALAALDALGALAAIDARLALPQALARRALAALPRDARPDVLLLAALLLGFGAGAQPEMAALLDRLEFPADRRAAAVRSAAAAPTLLAGLGAQSSPSAVHDALAGQPLEAVALALALCSEGAGRPDAAAVAAGEWLRTVRHIRLAITGDDLLAAGVPAGPEIGERLAAALRMRLDGRLADGPEAELRAALEAPS
jgi:tRNA nucleotidyltransferase (CCA-adding enzyme)